MKRYIDCTTEERNEIVDCLIEEFQDIYDEIPHEYIDEKNLPQTIQWIRDMVDNIRTRLHDPFYDVVPQNVAYWDYEPLPIISEYAENFDIEEDFNEYENKGFMISYDVNGIGMSIFIRTRDWLDDKKLKSTLLEWLNDAKKSIHDTIKLYVKKLDQSRLAILNIERKIDEQNPNYF